MDGTARSALVILSKGQLTEFPMASRLREAISDQRSVISLKQKAKTKFNIHFSPISLPSASSLGIASAIGSQLNLVSGMDRRCQFHLFLPHLPIFPAFGEFLLTRPKGTKSRR